MVNEVSAGGRAKPPVCGDDGSSNPSQPKSCGHPAAATSFTDPGKLDGVWPVAQVTVLAVDLLHRSAQGGWGRRGTLAERVARKRHHRASLFVCGNLRLSVRRRAGRRRRRREGRRPGGAAASSALVLLTHALWHPLRGAGVLGGVDRGWSLRSTRGSCLAPRPGWVVPGSGGRRGRRSLCARGRVSGSPAARLGRSFARNGPSGTERGGWRGGWCPSSGLRPPSPPWGRRTRCRPACAPEGRVGERDMPVSRSDPLSSRRLRLRRVP